jgi:GTP-binding protein
MIIKSAEFVISAAKASQYPTDPLPEIAFAGRSNVGKSSLINTLVNRKQLVKTSNTPGRTQLINFFCINHSFFLVDLPGYGYAKVPAYVQKKWGPMVETYIASRTNLKAVAVIMDIRRTPGTFEHDLLAWLKGLELAPILILTKADKISKINQKKQRQKIGATLGVLTDQLSLFSSKTRLGKEKVWQILNPLLKNQI